LEKYLKVIRILILKELNNIPEIKKSKMFIKFFGLEEYTDLDFDLELNAQKSSTKVLQAELKTIEETKDKSIIPKGDPGRDQSMRIKDLEENKNLKIDLNKINNYNPVEESDTGRSKRKNKNLSFS
jgi:hypothetical protein